MAKDKGQTGELVKSEPAALATVAAPVAEIEGSDNSRSLPALVLCQGTAEEIEMYGDGKRGKFLDALDGSIVGDKVNIVVCGGFMSWSKWVQGQKSPEYTVFALAGVPPEDREWQGEGSSRTPPAATECVNAVVCVEGCEWPFLFRFKRTGLKAYQKVIAPLESRRRTSGKGAAMYTLSHTPDKNPSGKPYLRLAARFAGEIPGTLAPLVNRVMTEWESFRAKAKAAVETEGDAGGGAEPDDGIPI